MPPLQPGEPGEGGDDDRDPIGGPDDADLDDVGFRPPLPQADRLWRHPSEVAIGRAAVATTGANPARRTAGVALLSGAVGAAVAVAVVAAVGVPEERVVERQVELRPATVLGDEGDGVAELVADAAPSVAALVVRGGGREWSGSAVVVRSDGHLVTDAAVVAAAERVDVVFHGGEVAAGEVVGVDEWTGVAVVHVGVSGLRPAALGDADALDAGSRTVLVAATADGGWRAWVSSAIVAAVDRRVGGTHGARYGMIVVDKPFPDTASGGALVDTGGAVVGIASGMRPSAATGSATPIELVEHAAAQLIEHGEVHHVWLGLQGVDVDAADVAAGTPGGAVVQEVVAGSPAAAAGIEAGDVIVAVDGAATPSMAALITAVRLHLPGDVVVVDLWRDGTERQVDVALETKTD